MPLVSGVCRAASAPMLSHGGSRLNASKPEANPKTSCPNPGYIHIHPLYIMISLKKPKQFFVGGKEGMILFRRFWSCSFQSFFSNTLFKSFYITFSKKPKNTSIQSNRLSRQKGLPTLSMARSTLKIHENFFFLNLLEILESTFEEVSSFRKERRTG